MWEITLQHEGLKKHRVIKGQDKTVVEEKARLQEEVWEEQWEKKLDVEARKQGRENKARDREEKKQLGLERTQEAQLALESLEQTLAHTFDIDDTIEWDSLRDKRGFHARHL